MTIKDEIKLPNVTFVKGDIGDRELVTKIMNEFDPDFVVNFAAESHVDRSIENPRLFLETNILGTQNMLDCAREAWFAGKDENGTTATAKGKNTCRFPRTRCTAHFPKTLPSRSPCILQMQSRKWSKGARTYRHSATDFSLRTPPLPRSPYSAAKTGADLITQAYHETYGMPVNITRCSNNYGPYHFPEKLIPLIIKNILEGKNCQCTARATTCATGFMSRTTPRA